MGKLIRSCVIAILLVAAVVAAVAPASAQTPPWSAPQLHFHQVLTSPASNIPITGIPNGRDTLRLVVHTKSSDTSNTSGVAPNIMLQINGNVSANYSSTIAWWNGVSGGQNHLLNQPNGVRIGQAPNKQPTFAADAVGVTECLLPGYANAVYDKVGFCDSAFSIYDTTGTGLFRTLHGIRWNPTTPAAISSLLVYMSLGQLETGTIVDLYLE